MDAFALAGSTASSFSINRPLFSFLPPTRRVKALRFRPKKPRCRLLASSESPELDEWDHMELKYGRLLGEDPKLTMAKVMGRKLDPGVSYLDIEKSFYKNKVKLRKKDKKKLPFIGPGEEFSTSSLNGSNSAEGETKFEAKSKNPLNLTRPVPRDGSISEEEKKSIAAERNASTQSGSKPRGNARGTIPNAILRKPSMFYEDNEETKELLRIGPNLSLKMGNEANELNFRDNPLNFTRPIPRDGSRFEEEKKSITAERNAPTQSGSKACENAGGTIPNAILRKPSKFYEDNEETKELLRVRPNLSLKMGNEANKLNFSDITLLKKPEPSGKESSATECLESGDETTSQVPTDLVDSDMKFSTDAPPKEETGRHPSPGLDQRAGMASDYNAAVNFNETPEHNTDAVGNVENTATSSLKGQEDIEWTRAENLSKNGGKVEVELISSSSKGFVVSFGPLIGFLPYRNLVARLKFLAFESWLRRKGVDPYLYKQNLDTVGNFKVTNENSLHGSSVDAFPNMKFDGLLQIYDQEKNKFLSSFVDQRIKVNVVSADRKSRKLIVSMKPKETEEFVEKKRSLMAKLSIGDVVKCCITKITYFGIFVEIEGVPALIHQTEVSWDGSLEPSSYFKIGQILEAKVCQLDFSLERILLSLKEITPDPLIEALECVVGERDCLDGRLEAAQADAEWGDVESLVRELQKTEGIHSVSKGRFFFSPGLAPTFQVYMASMFENQYKLLARSGNKVQEVIVQSSLQKEEMKSVILTCTNRVE